MITIHDDRTLTFRVFRCGAGRVELMADCTNWDARRIPLEPDRDADRPGWWRVTLALPPGEHRFGYLIDGHEWQPDYAAHGIELSPHNSFHSIVRVPDEATTAVVPVVARVAKSKVTTATVVTRPAAAWQQDIHSKLAA